LAPMLRSHPAASSQDIVQVLEERQWLSTSACDKSDLLGHGLGIVGYSGLCGSTSILDFLQHPRSSPLLWNKYQRPWAASSLTMVPLPVWYRRPSVWRFGPYSNFGGCASGWRSRPGTKTWHCKKFY
jgi:hypothetical protein